LARLGADPSDGRHLDAGRGGPARRAGRPDRRSDPGLRRGARNAGVEVELRDGPATVLRSLSAEPGYGFLTLLPHGEDGGEEEWIVPVAAVARITLRQAEEREPVGFSLPAA
jgi:hypothetical protein